MSDKTGWEGHVQQSGIALGQTRPCLAPWARPKKVIMRWSPLKGYIVWGCES